MNHTQILKRSWKILWSYKTLWIFGILLALVSGGGGGSSGGSNASNRINNNNNNNGDSFNLPRQSARSSTNWERCSRMESRPK